MYDKLPYEKYAQKETTPKNKEISMIARGSNKSHKSFVPKHRKDPYAQVDIYREQ